LHLGLFEQLAGGSPSRKFIDGILKKPATKRSAGLR